MTLCAGCGCPEIECLDLRTQAFAADEDDVCCFDCSHVVAAATAQPSTVSKGN